jgi:superfamily I DNA/RNA helicase
LGHWDDIRREAQRKRAELISNSTTGSLATAALRADQLLCLAEEQTGVPRIPLSAHDPLLYGAEAWLSGDEGDEVIYYNQDAGDWQSLFYQAHEYAHLWLHHAHGANAIHCEIPDVDPAASEAALPMGIERVQGYGPKERREREANVFAREFLLPADELRCWYLHDGLDLFKIAGLAGVPPSMVAQQLTYALLTAQPTEHESEPVTEEETPTSLTLDSSQGKTAYVAQGPLLVEAGPGTGKTRTLVGRILYLLDQGVAPSSILALTFSNKAAEEMRTRVAGMAPEQAPHIWMGTFHAFGLELLRKYGTRIGLPAKPRMLDPVDALFALENALPELRLDHYMNLYEPTIYLRDILGAISRAKDELVGAERYRELAQAMLDAAGSDEEIEKAEKALEVARVYEFYQAYLQKEGLVDFGDLIFRAVMLLREHPDVRARVRNAYSHILVDEYQDVNRASGLLLRELAGSGEGLWAVGDARQAIYRFRGAAPSNMDLFTSDFPGANVLPLEVNYRSQSPIVATFSELAPRMRSARGAVFTSWQTYRPHSGGRVLMEIATSEQAEAQGLAEEIERERAAGIPYREQAILSRSHTTLERLSVELERRGIPVLYLGDLFERPEIRDLLALLQLVCAYSGSSDDSGDSAALVRVARFREYAIPLADVRATLALVDPDVSFAEALDLATEAENISDEGKAGLALLVAHLEEVATTERSAWNVLARYLFGVSHYLDRLLSDNSVSSQQQRLAIFQFLQFTMEEALRPVPESRQGTDPKRYLLGYIRRLEIFGEEKALRQVPEWAEGIDAVRMLTVHASKGLEFRAVYLPKLATGHFPSSRKAVFCPPPKGMLADDEEDWHEEEEECLFFVALSRARDVLCLSRAQQYGKRNSNASKFLASISASLPNRVDGAPTWASNPGAGQQQSATLQTPTVKPRYSLQMLETYMRCPRRFYYDYMLGLGGEEDVAAYVQFHRCVYQTLGWLREERAAGRVPGIEEAVAHLDEVWAEQGPRGHIHEALYHERAEGMVARAVDRHAGSTGRMVRAKWDVQLAFGRISFKPDNAELVKGEDVGGVGGGERSDLLTLQRMRTGRPSSTEKDDPIYALYHAAAAREYPNTTVQVQTVYLASGAAEDVQLTPRQIESRLDKYNNAMLGILTGDFHAAPSERQCPRCPYYFICPAAEDEPGRP